jgi:hypothetical protein
MNDKNKLFARTSEFKRARRLPRKLDSAEVPVRTKATRQAAALDPITALQAKPERIKSFFQHACVKCAA